MDSFDPSWSPRVPSNQRLPSHASPLATSYGAFATLCGCDHLEDMREEEHHTWHVTPVQSSWLSYNQGNSQRSNNLSINEVINSNLTRDTVGGHVTGRHQRLWVHVVVGAVTPSGSRSDRLPPDNGVVVGVVHHGWLHQLLVIIKHHGHWLLSGSHDQPSFEKMTIQIMNHEPQVTNHFWPPLGRAVWVFRF